MNILYSKLMKNLIIIIGPPGSGKSLAGDLIVKHLNAKKISTGEILREQISQNLLPLDIADKVLNGVLISDDIVNDIVKRELESDCDNIILDGYPRNFSQFITLQEMVGKSFDICCIHMKTPHDLILKRISQRRVCECCGKSYTSKEQKCLSCGGALIKRPDDVNIKHRLEDYIQITEPVFTKSLRYWCNKTITVDVSLDSDILAIKKEVATQLNKFFQ